MSEELKEIARRTLEDIFPACDVAGLAEVTDPNVIDHGARPDEPAGFEGAKASMLWLGRVFSDQRWEVHQTISEGDVVVVRATHHGRHTGNLMGIEPTGREVAYEYVHILRFRDGKAIEHWGYRDHVTLMQQLGVMPGRPASAGVTASAAAPS